MNIPFSRPLIDEPVLAEMQHCLLETGWLTSGTKVLEFEKELLQVSGAKAVVAVNSWASGAMLALKWFGIGPGDEVIVPAYTYAATALCAIHLGARVIMVDVLDDFTLDPAALEQAITEKTKAILPVDIGGWPARYQEIFNCIQSDGIRRRFRPQNEMQERLGRILVLADAAHSLGAGYTHRPIGAVADITVFSFHSVKNITTGEGGAVALHLPPGFDAAEDYRFLKTLSLNGQTKSAFEKNQAGGWRYDIIAPGLKANMPDICAAVGLAQIRRYQDHLLPERQRLFQQYLDFFKADETCILPPFQDENGTQSSAHLFMLRLAGVTESFRDRLIQQLAALGIGLNVHYLPLPRLTYFKNAGFETAAFPRSNRLYETEITLPLYNGLSTEAVEQVCHQVQQFVHQNR